MNQILDVRNKIYNHFHASKACQTYFCKPENRDTYAAYYTSMYLIQDTGEALWHHRNQDFSGDSLTAYIEFWGVMQAIIIQQDAILELYEKICDEKINTSKLSSGNKLRALRNCCAGHPVAHCENNLPLKRTFMSRSFGNYQCVQYELWDSSKPEEFSKHPKIALDKLIDDYETEAVKILQNILRTMQQRWSI